ncbi:hypothetical protein NA57DRAFT_71181 [Rhizodiscina lignyota]|uniref:Peptidase M20 domain-containing protein 2 n=1 Tax=Rhizodiscina lignyota TaxID=1504668 RepID=A0A9P4ITA8_9PEZI|nr:hypothetical protein NA57DRAFT_71181 [Rhizodiscina lignyota]
MGVQNFPRRLLLSVSTIVALLANQCLATPQADVSDLPAHLEALRPKYLPDFRNLAEQIYNHPEIGRSEFFAHNITMEYFQKEHPGLWEVTPSILKTLPTAWKLEYSHRPSDWPEDKPLPIVGFMSEMDALEGIGHSCGHHLIHMQGLYAASLARQALIDYNIAGRLVHVGTPDEEEACGKHDLAVAGVFEESQVWLMCHPTISSDIQPMSWRDNIIVRVIEKTHFEAVKAVYNMLVPIRNLIGKLPGTNSTASIVEDVGMFVCNVVEADIALGVVGPDIATVNDTINAIKSSNAGYVTTNFTVAKNAKIEGGIDIMFHGNAGHTASNNLGALDMSVDAFQALNASDPSFEFYMPDNTTSSELDFTVDCRTRWTDEGRDVINAVLPFITTKNYVLDVEYPALEIDPYLGQLFVDTIALPEYGKQIWPITPLAPAATDAGWVQQAIVNSDHTVKGFGKAVVHANYNICPSNQTICPFNHEPLFRPLAGLDFAYQETEKVARALAQIAVELLNDPEKMAVATKDIIAGPKKRV